MLAYGLEENNQFDDAEKAAIEVVLEPIEDAACSAGVIIVETLLQALAINGDDGWATHALAHTYEMTGEFDKGIR